jgi:hypothetical protein
MVADDEPVAGGGQPEEDRSAVTSPDPELEATYDDRCGGGRTLMTSDLAKGSRGAGQVLTAAGAWRAR